MKEFARWMVSIDRRIIFVLIALGTLLPLLHPFGLPIKVSPEVRGVYDYIENLPEGSVFFLSLDFDPSSKPELEPQAVALLRHAFRKHLRVIGMTHWLPGTGLADSIFARVAKEMGKQAEKDYVFLGWSPGTGSLVIAMGQDLYKAFPSDNAKHPTVGMPVLEGVRNLRDVNYLISLAAGNPGIEMWYVFGKDKYRFEMAGGSTGVMAPGLYPFLRSGQINGLIGGLQGAAEYETLIGQKGTAVAGMDAQSADHFVIITLVLLCNVFYFVLRGDKGRPA
ncbi:MAG TPA: hypothetical protein VGJ57_08820 [Nitrospirales bacterium]